jgi:hypothetical protein
MSFNLLTSNRTAADFNPAVLASNVEFAHRLPVIAACDQGRGPGCDRAAGAGGFRDSLRIAARDASAVPGAATLNTLGTEVDGTWRYRAIRANRLRIDYIFVSAGATVASYVVITGPWGAADRRPSLLRGRGGGLRPMPGSGGTCRDEGLTRRVRADLSTIGRRLSR